MIAFRVEIDSDLVTTAGAEDWALLALHITASRAAIADAVAPTCYDSIRYSVGGLSNDNTEGVARHFRWKERDLSIGTTMLVTIVDVDAPDQPLKRYRSDATVQENPFTEDEMREFRYRDYLELKKEFERSS